MWNVPARSSGVSPVSAALRSSARPRVGHAGQRAEQQRAGLLVSLGADLVVEGVEERLQRGLALAGHHATLTEGAVSPPQPPVHFFPPQGR